MSNEAAASPRKKSAVPKSAGVKVFPIVGIGASAGGLEALEAFFGHLPANCGMAFVVIQHLDPSHKGVMPELLQRATAMKVVEAEDRLKVKPNCVYVIPPNKDLSILHGTLHLLDPIAPRGLRQPIDFFFRALADDRREAAVGIVLSGMGSDGSLGLRAIKEHAGLVLVQEPSSAKFDGMPRSAINAGLADLIASAQELPKALMQAVRRIPMAAAAGLAAEPETPSQKSALEKICLLLRAQTGHDFSLYKRSTIYRRIERRMSIHQISRIADYVRYLHENSQELQLLFKELLIGVTSFFRDPDVWTVLEEQALPALLADRPAGKPLRAWVAGCSTGEEAYSLAIAFREALDRVKPKGRLSLQIFATDLDADAIDRARQGCYPANIAADVSPERLARFFVKDEGGYQVAKEIREMVVFAPQNVIMDPPFTKLDILTCRNLLIYLGPELQKRLLPLFHYSLNPGGILFLGNAESIGGATELFAPVDGKARLFRRTDDPGRALDLEFPTRHSPMHSEIQEIGETRSVAANLQSLADQLLLQKYSPAAVLVNSDGDVLYISGRTGKYLEPAAGKANWNIHAMAREGLRHEIAMALPKALRSKDCVICQNLRVGTNGGTQSLDLSVHPIEEPADLRGMAMLVFADIHAPVAAPADHKGSVGGRRVAELERALQQARDENQAIREQMQTSQEELKSANEELQSTNEELQSTNEELTTSKEEMQSMNEELQTVNAELQSKVDELSSTSNDMKNLLNSTDIATVFLDSALHIRRFTTQATRVFKLIPSDIGRPLSDIVSPLQYSGLSADAEEVLRTLAFSEKEIATGDGRWFMVRIMPYRTFDNVIDGVVITFADISAAKHLEAELRAVQGKATKGISQAGPP